MKAHPEVLEVHDRDAKAQLELWRLTLQPWSSPEAIKADPGAMEALPGALEAQPGVMEARPGDVDCNPRTMELTLVPWRLIMEAHHRAV
jgi:hypothetical protein